MEPEVEAAACSGGLEVDSEAATMVDRRVGATAAEDWRVEATTVGD